MLTFKSWNGNSYIYDDETGMIFTNNTDHSALKQWSKENRKYKVQSSVSIDPEIMLNHGFFQLTLEVTEDCNLRCKYCILENNLLNRSYSKKKMDWSTAKQAIDYYYSQYERAYQRQLSDPPYIAFYGGEPLLNFELIKKSVEYVSQKTHLPNPIYYITTNGTLLTEEISNFLKENKFNISISIDGPEEEHNRNRIFQDGIGTFSCIKENIEQYLKGYENLNTISVHDWETDLCQVDEFFKEFDLSPVVTSKARVNPDSTYFQQFSEESQSRYQSYLDTLGEKYVSNILEAQDSEEPFLSVLFQKVLEVVLKPSPHNPKSIWFSATNACLPGSKVFVTTDGQIHMCERVSTDYPIGNIADGLNYEKINSIVREYKKGVVENCVEGRCPIKRFCNLCYIDLIDKENFVFNSELCTEQIALVTKALEMAVTIGEERGGFFDTPRLPYHTNLKKFLGGDSSCIST